MKNRISRLLFLYSCLIGAGYAQDSLNISLISTYDWPVDSARVFEIELKDYCLYAFGSDMEEGFRIINISDPLNPTLIGSADCFSPVFESTIINQTLFVMTSYALVIFDVSDPEDPQLLSETFFEGGMSYPNLFVDGDYVYIGNYDELKVVDISDLESPEIVVFSMFIGIARIQDLIIHNDILFLSMSYPAPADGIILYDISNPESPDSLDYVLRDVPGYDNMIANENILYTSSLDFIRLYNISNPYNPIALGSYPRHYLITGQMILRDNFLYFGDGTVTVLDVSNAESLEVVGYNNNYGSSSDYEYRNGLLYSAEYERIGIYDCSGFNSSPEPVTKLLPASFSMKPAYPNPFNPSTVIPFSITYPGDVRFSVYNIVGQQISSSREFYKTGEHRFILDADVLGTDPVSGTYYLKMEFESETRTQRLNLIR